MACSRRLATLTALLLLGCHRQPPSDPALLELGGEAVRRSEFDGYIAGLEGRGMGPLSAEARRGLLEAFLEQRALAIEARRRGFLVSGGSAEEQGAAVARLLATAVAAPEVAEAEIAAWHAAHRQELAQKERVRLRQVLVSSLNEAREVKRRLAREPRLFDTLARTRSKGPEAALGGYMGSFARGELPTELEQAAFSLPSGATSDPIESPLGYHVLRVESREAARDVPLDEARDQIRERLVREKRVAAERAFIAQLLARAKVNHEAAFVLPGVS